MPFLITLTWFVSPCPVTFVVLGWLCELLVTFDITDPALSWLTTLVAVGFVLTFSLILPFLITLTLSVEPCPVTFLVVDWPCPTLSTGLLKLFFAWLINSLPVVAAWVISLIDLPADWLILTFSSPPCVLIVLSEDGAFVVEAFEPFLFDASKLLVFRPSLIFRSLELLDLRTDCRFEAVGFVPSVLLSMFEFEAPLLGTSCVDLEGVATIEDGLNAVVDGSRWIAFISLSVNPLFPNIRLASFLAALAIGESEVILPLLSIPSTNPSLPEVAVLQARSLPPAALKSLYWFFNEFAAFLPILRASSSL